MQRTKSIVLSLLFSMAFSLARAEWRFDADTGFVYESNLSNSDRDAEEKDDWAWKSDLRVANAFQLSRDLRLNVGADLRGELWDRFGAFNTIGPGATAGLRYRMGLGRQAPWVLVEDRFGYDRFQDTAQSGYDNVVDLRTGIALSDRVAVEGSYGFESFVAPNDFYDRQNHRANARLIFDVTSSLQLAFGYTYREGDVISYAVPPRPDIARFAIEREDEDDFDFPLRTAYKLLGRSHAVSIAAGYAVTKNVSVQVSYEYVGTWHDPLHYENHLVEARLTFTY